MRKLSGTESHIQKTDGKETVGYGGDMAERENGEKRRGEERRKEHEPLSKPRSREIRSGEAQVRFGTIKSHFRGWDCSYGRKRVRPPWDLVQYLRPEH